VSIPIFIIGCDRSGTCWLGNILQNHPQIQATIEHPDVFPLVTQLALNPQKENELYPKIVKFYQTQLMHTTSKYYADKSHPNLWIAEQLSETFKDALFIGIVREPLGAISSMKKHYSLGTSWHDVWKKNSIPNKFLGITESNTITYDYLIPVAQYTMQWGAHLKEMIRLKSVLGPKLFIIRYENLINKNHMFLLKLQEFLGLSSSLICDKIKRESLYKWKKNLNCTEVDCIHRLVKLYKRCENEI
jgi:hypothetical protein